MSFFYNETKSAPKKKAPSSRAVIPVASLQQLGCQACPRDTDRDLRSPKMRPSGASAPLVYLLGSAPSVEEDDDNNHWTDKAGDVIYKAFGAKTMRNEVRSNFIMQCRGDSETAVVATECCRPRIVDDIEATKPLVVVTIGDLAWQWATGATGSVMPHRGYPFVARIGTHQCYVLPILYPNFVHKKNQYGKSEYELAMEFDIRAALQLAEDIQTGQREPARAYWGKELDAGLELITGNEPGDFQRLERLLADFSGERRVGVDVETNGLRPFFLKDPKIWMLSTGTYDHSICFPMDHPEGWGTDARRRKVWGLVGEYLMHSGHKVAHNLAMEMEWFHYFYGPKVLRQTQWEDTMAMAHTLDERSGTKGLEMQTIRHFGFNLKKLSNIDVKRILEYPLERTLKYCALDTKWTHKLADHLEPLVNRENPQEYWRKVRLAPVLVRTEAKGLPVDFDYAQKLHDGFQDTLERVEAKLRKLPEIQKYERTLGKRFSPTAPDDVLKLMRDICGRDEVREEDSRTGAVSYTTAEENLAAIPANEVPSAPLILEHRAASKNDGTYLLPILKRDIVCPDGKVRSKYSSMTAETGRLASEDPNVQNFPKRKHKEIRGVIYAPKGYIFGALDYGQIEFRVVGMASEDPAIVKACWTGYDVHMFWAKRLLKIYPTKKDDIVENFADVMAEAKGKAKKDGKDYDEEGLIYKLLRQDMKNMWVFPQLFGSSVNSCAVQLHLPRDIADDLAEEFWDEFRATKAWQKKLLERYQKTLYVETLGGRKRRGPMTPNQIINHPIQGTAFDIVGEAMQALSEKAEAEDDDYYQAEINVHDDLTFILPEATHLRYIDDIAKEMCKHRFNYLNVPLLVEASTGYRWHELKEIKKYYSYDLYPEIVNPYR